MDLAREVTKSQELEHPKPENLARALEDLMTMMLMVMVMMMAMMVKLVMMLISMKVMMMLMMPFYWSLQLSNFCFALSQASFTSVPCCNNSVVFIVIIFVTFIVIVTILKPSYATNRETVA